MTTQSSSLEISPPLPDPEAIRLRVAKKLAPLGIKPWCVGYDPETGMAEVLIGDVVVTALALWGNDCRQLKTRVTKQIIARGKP